MISKDDKKKVILVLSSVFLASSMLLIALFSNKKPDIKVLEKNLEMINAQCNSVYKDMENNEKKYKELLKIEKDYFKKGMYASVLTQFYAIKGDYENIMKYAKIAQTNYNMLEGGEYYVIADKKYIAWVMLRNGNYPESFRVTSELLDLLNANKIGLLTEAQVKDTEALIYSIFLYIYSHFNIIDKAEIYYDKLNEIEMTQELKVGKGDKIAASKMMYAEKIEDYELMKKYAYECYEISLEKDKKNNTDMSDSVISNIAYTNVKLGKYDEAKEQLERSEAFHKKIDDKYGLVTTYANYATYYEAIEQLDLAIEYYKKTLEIYNETENYYGVEESLKGFINFLEDNGITENIDECYKAYYDLVQKIDEKAPVNDFLSQVISINDELNKSTVLLLKEKSKLNEKGITIAIFVIIILTALITRLNKLIRIKKESEKKLEHIANTDYLTGLNTRAYGEKLILREMKKGTRLSIGVIDIDNFKYINDTHGHIFGDFILKEVAKYIKDSLGEEAIITRFGGEEFTIAFIGKGKLEAKEILDRIREDINSIVFDNDARVSFSAGIKEWDKTDLNILIKQADELLYRAKREGRNRVLI